MKDGYQLFLERFNIKEDELFQFGIDSLITIPKPIAKLELSSLVGSISKGGTAHIRSYGVKGQNSQILLSVYKTVFPNLTVKIDKTNNQKASQLIFKHTAHTKLVGRSNSLYNFQTSHVFSRTKNPFCFLAPWNIVLLPKILDPLTGHEAKGNLVITFTKRFRERVFGIFAEEIAEFNSLMDIYQPKVIECLNNISIPPGMLKKLQETLEFEFSKIEI